MRSEEGYLEVPGGRVFWRSVGEGGVPLLCLHGGPGFTHDNLEALAGLAEHRRVIFWDQLGCGRSDQPDDLSLWTVERFVEEVSAVRTALGLDRVHLLGSSWGGMLAMQYVVDRHDPGIVSLVIASSPASMRRWVQGCDELLAGLEPKQREELRRHEAAGWTGCPEYAAALVTFYRRHVCRMDPWPAGLERSFAGHSVQVYEYMNGPSEFTVVGTLQDWDITDRLGEIDIPTLVTSGEYDELRPAEARLVAGAIPGAELRIFDDASHLTFGEVPDVYLPAVADFQQRAEHTAGITG